MHGDAKTSGAGRVGTRAGGTAPAATSVDVALLVDGRANKPEHRGRSFESSSSQSSWRKSVELLVGSAGHRPVVGTRKARLRIKEITGGRCLFRATGATSSVGFSSATNRIGRIRIDVLRWTGNASCETVTWRSSDHHLSMHVALAHAFDVKQGDEWITVAPGTGLVLSGPGETRRRWAGASDLLNIMIDREALDQQVMLATSPSLVSASLPKLTTLRLDEFPSLTRFLSLLVDDLNVASSLLRRPEVACESNRLLIQLIVAASQVASQSQSAVYRHVVVPAYVRAAERFMRDNYPLRLDMEKVAANCQISIRALQSGFRKFRGTTPSEFLRSVRLAHARHDLQSRPTLSISSVAHSVGYRSHSQFARDYKNVFGETPKTTRSGGK